MKTKEEAIKKSTAYHQSDEGVCDAYLELGKCNCGLEQFIEEVWDKAYRKGQKDLEPIIKLTAMNHD